MQQVAHPKLRMHTDKTFRAMGSEFYVKISDPDSYLVDFAQQEILRLENLWSRFLPNSEITLLNNSEGNAVFVSEETTLLVKKMIHGFKITQGAYDPTILPVLIKVGYKNSLVNSQNTTKVSESAKWPTELLNTQINGNLIFLPIGTTLDPGGIGKGLAADLLCEKLMSMGATGCLVSAGGDVRVKGTPTNAANWLIAIEDPLDATSYVDQIHLRDGALATSSRMKRKFSNDANHLINVETGVSAQENIQSVSVIAGNAALAEVLCKVPFSKDLQSSFELIEAQNAAAMAITEDDLVHFSNSWKRYQCE